jgi:nitrate reductase NapE component
VDLKSGSTRPSTIFQNVSPFKKKEDKSSHILQIIILVLAVGALGCFLFLLWKFLQTPH